MSNEIQTTEIALAICIVLVLVLLSGCWKSKSSYDYAPRRSGCSSKQTYRSDEGLTSHKPGMSGYNDYNEEMQKEGLESDVGRDHHAYTQSDNIVNLGASALSVTDHEVDTNWYRIRPTYTNQNFSNDNYDASVSSNTVEQLKPASSYKGWNMR
jgi:hypothetical protein